MQQPIFHKTLLATAITSLTLSMMPAQAQDAMQGINQSQAQTIQLAQADSTQSFAIPAQALTSALDQFSNQTGIAFAYTSSELEGIQSPGVRGEISSRQALNALLAGTGVTAQFSGDDSVALTKAQQQSVLELERVRVVARANTRSAPVEGFRAERSSSATNVDAPLIETPATVNVITRDFMDILQPQRVEDIFSYVPGASAESFFGSGDSGFNLRGFSTSTRATQQGASVFVDNFRAPGFRYHFDPYLYERIDVLKGNASLLYGSAPPGGIVRYTAKRPEFESRHRIETTIGSFDTTRGMIDSTGPLNEAKTLAYRLIVAGSSFNQTVHGKNDDVGYDDRILFKPAITWLMPTGGELYASYEYSQRDAGNDPGIPYVDGEFIFDSDPLLSSLGGIETEHHIGVVELTQPIADNWEIFVGGRAEQTDVVRAYDVAFNFNDTPAYDQRQENTVTDHPQYEIRTELRGAFSTGEHITHQITLGYNWFDTEDNRVRGFGRINDSINPLNPVFAPVTLPEPITENPSTLESHTFYLQDYISVGEKLKLFGGLSYIDVEATIASGPTYFAAGEEQQLDWSIGAIYNHSAFFNPFLSYSTSLAPQTGLLANGSALEFRDGDQIEAGLKSEWFNNRLITTASVFQTEQTNIAEGDPVNPGFSILVGDQRTRGFEFELAGKVTEQVTLYAAYSHMDAEFTKSVTNNEGNTPANVPEDKFSLFGEYAFAGDLNGWSLGAGVIHVGERQGDSANTFRLPSYERVDLTLSYEQGAFDLRATVENLFDEEYVLASPSGTTGILQGAPRFFRLSVGYNF